MTPLYQVVAEKVIKDFNQEAARLFPPLEMNPVAFSALMVMHFWLEPIKLVNALLLKDAFNSGRVTFGRPV